MTPSDHKTISAMSEYGGSFVKALAEATRVADSHNLEKIKTAFSGIWRKYERFSVLTEVGE